MKIILSRKGFDSGSGGCASPVLPDGTMLSLPIPETGEDMKSALYKNTFADLTVKCLGEEFKYNDILCSLQRTKINNFNKYNTFCHVDPDLNGNKRKKEINNWIPGFGQCDAAQTHLDNMGVSTGDLFLFFGWFKKATFSVDKQIVYKDHSQGFHAIFGYMQIGEIIKGNDIPLRLPWHPHASPRYNKTVKNNTVYVPSRELIINGKQMGVGADTFRFNDRLVLSKDETNRSQWKLLDWMTTTPISYHSQKSIHNGYFQSAKRGQEFVFEANKDVLEWISTIYT